MTSRYITPPPPHFRTNVIFPLAHQGKTFRTVRHDNTDEFDTAELRCDVWICHHVVADPTTHILSEKKVTFSITYILYIVFVSISKMGGSRAT
ncbi:hypothetical protein AVEN_210140-1 [Araneus ventricosus]|uniref:Uncharacterized protein n=1 Tax=Araneus ventricosus TaxID=182803 RepID=A0A4Y2ST42_ARAVE|nr:hypothetical protein AVEN_210140-1 [Araneus ventricosus]